MSIQVVYAIVKAGGRQEKVSVGDVVVVDKVACGLDGELEQAREALHGVRVAQVADGGHSTDGEPRLGPHQIGRALLEHERAQAAPAPATSAVASTTTNGCLTSVPDPGTSTPVQICYSLFKPAGASRRIGVFEAVSPGGEAAFSFAPRDG